jgi:vitamin K-dependent gamma-carboxylase-like protein
MSTYLDLFSRARRASERFAFSPARAEPLAALRIGLALVLLVQAASIAPWYRELYGDEGILPPPLQDVLARPGLPCLNDLIRLFAPAGIGGAAVATAVASLYLLALTALLLGLRTRAAAVAAWLLHMVLMAAADGTNYGADQIAHVFLFYLLWAPSGAALSLDRCLGWAAPGPTPMARFSLRVIQVQLCIIYLTGGVAKAMSRPWWNGDSIWRSVMSPEYRQLDFSWLAQHPWIAVVAGWGVILVETGYAFLIWPRRTRRIWVLSAMALHLGTALFMGFTIFGGLMMVLTFAAFGVRAEPRD